MSRSKFANLFNSIIGEPPLTYLQHYRFRLASQYLRTSNLSIQQISNKVGYSSETAFSQAFKRVFDLSPKQYRQNYIGSNLRIIKKRRSAFLLHRFYLILACDFKYSL
jgi:AraC-like DNA-binding protein